MKKMDSLKRTVLEICIGIVFFGVLFEILGILFVEDKVSYSIGLLCGVVTAIGLLLYMAYHLNRALDLGENNARRIIRKGTVIRYGVVALITILLVYYGIGNILSYFLGILTLKMSAYIQPAVHKLWNKIFHIEEVVVEHGFYDSRFD